MDVSQKKGSRFNTYRGYIEHIESKLTVKRYSHVTKVCPSWITALTIQIQIRRLEQV